MDSLGLFDDPCVNFRTLCSGCSCLKNISVDSKLAFNFEIAAQKARFCSFLVVKSEIVFFTGVL